MNEKPTTVISHVWKQPLYKTLMQYKIIGVLAIAIFTVLQWEIWFYYREAMDYLMESGKPLPSGWDVALLAFAGTNVGAIWAAIKHIEARNKSIEQEYTK